MPLITTATPPASWSSEEQSTLAEQKLENQTHFQPLDRLQLLKLYVKVKPRGMPFASPISLTFTWHMARGRIKAEQG